MLSIANEFLSTDLKYGLNKPSQNCHWDSGEKCKQNPGSS